MSIETPIAPISPRRIAALTALLCLLIVVLGVAAAIAEPRLRPIVEVEDDVVRLKDLVDGLGREGDVAVFGAPQPGGSGRISAARIVAAARDHGVPAVATGGLSTVAVRRLGRVVGAEEIAEAVRAAIVRERKLPADTEIELASGRMEAVVESAAKGAVVVRSLNVHPSSGRFEASYSVEGSRALELEPARVVGTISDIARVPVLTRAVLKGDVIQPGDIALERRRRSELGQEAAADAARIAGNAAKRAMGRGTILREADVQRPDLVERNAVVLMTYEQPGLQLSMRGRALQAGAMGDVIQIMNLNSRKTVEAIVTGPNRAAVTGAVLGPQKTTQRGDLRQQ